MALSVYYKGNIRKKEAHAASQWLKRNKKVVFVDNEWAPFRFGISEKPIILSDDSEPLAPMRRSAVMLGNNTAIGRVFEEATGKKFDYLFAFRAFVHWYKKEGMEEGEFIEARENLALLHMDYLEILMEMSTDDALKLEDEFDSDDW